MITVTNTTECVYKFGIDPKWSGTTASNSKTFVNSIKMKFAISIGIIQMILGK
jgi:vacuolar-type H+-ATPase subunit I/STV1